ncbi:major facilitator superfamily domain-containing protein [Circinella umbellata]|nr:major facilitator superfamily domain-containing protein [Circinella umbellata]
MFDNSKQSQFLVSCVGTICYFVSEIVTPLVQIILERTGVRITLLIGTIMISTGLVTSGFATTVWHLYISQGICYGVGISMIYLAIMTVIPQWFSQRFSTAIAISMSSIGLAGLVIPIIMYTSNSKLGGSWTFWILGIVYFGANILSCALIKEKSKREQLRVSKSMVKELLVDINFLTFTGAAFLQVLSRNVPFFFLPSYATFVGLNATQGTSLISIACAASFGGRIVVGVLADRIGNLYVGAIFSIITGLSSLVIWMFAYSYPMLVVLAIIIGFSFDTYYILMPPTLLQILGRQKYTTGLSLLMVLTSPAILGPSLISAVDGALDCEQFLPHKIFSGVLPILSSIIMLLLRLRIKRQQKLEY